jgi:hypothetical protein
VQLASELGEDVVANDPDHVDDIGGHYLGHAPVQVGKGHCALSWLWFNPLLLDIKELDNDPRLIECEFLDHFVAVLSLIKVCF